MKINTEEELLKSLEVTKIITIKRFETKGTFTNENLYEGHWNILNNKIKRAIGQGTGGVALWSKWQELEPTHRDDFIDRFKTAHQEYDNLGRTR
jgi:hypothetical protein